MKSTLDKRKAGLISRISHMLRSRLSQGSAEPAARFARNYYARVAAEDLTDQHIEDLYGAVLSHWQLAHRRTPGEALVHIYNPVHEQHGWRSPHTVVELVCDDSAFLVDSVNILMMRRGITVHLIIHPVMRVRRDRNGRLLDVLREGIEGADIMDEAIMHFQIDQQSASTLAALEAGLKEVLHHVRRVVNDWPHMRSRLMGIIAESETKELPIPAEELTEDLEFLRWLAQDHFTFIGFRAFDLIQHNAQDCLRMVPGSGLGMFRDIEPKRESIIREHLRDLARSPQLLILTKSSTRSMVHRPAHLDYVGIRRFDDNGKLVGEWRFLGLYASLTYDTRPAEIPLLRRKVSKVFKLAAAPPDSYSGRSLQRIIDNLPRDEMFQATEDELFNIAMGILYLQDHQRFKVFIRHDAFERFMSVLVFVPRDQYNTQLRLRMESILMEAFNGQSSEFDTQFNESVLARVHFIIHTVPGKLPDYDIADIEARMIAAMLRWRDRLSNELHEQFGEREGNHLSKRYAEAFSPAYRGDYSARTAVQDIRHLESLQRDKSLSMHLYHPLEDTGNLLRFKVFGRRKPMALSNILPLLEKMGLRVLAARPYIIKTDNAISYWIINFEMTTAYDIRGEVLQVKEIFQEAFARVYRGETENDGFNRLVLAAKLQWREVLVLRAVCKYLLQTQVPFSQTYMEKTLSKHPDISRTLIRLFEARFDPQLKDDRDELTVHLNAQIEQAIDEVDSLDEDRILRHFLATVMAMLRTNYYQLDSHRSSKDYLSFKLDPSRLPELPLPRPRFEIFVYSTHMEGIHLRGGRVARGGLRWSDRREDFRTEILGLMKAQMIKNAVIVPVGAKGGFVTKKLPSSADRNEIQQELVYCYRTFIQGLLDITDNYKVGEITTPQNVVRHDGDDPYLVVAADKGTASFSDLANEIAADYDFWLGDAFASGGTHGYDHKKMGITARGAWESVKRHFRELGMDIQNTPFSVVGIGDMSGDVFGNGMLQSEHMRLIAAFNHLHIFIDPDPEPSVAYTERQRLFALPRSSWNDYDTKKLSKGGGIYARSAKSIVLEPEAQQALGIKAQRLTPNALIQAILKSPVDLLWNGGIGTYVKASTESHSDVGDRSNDAVRVNANELGCRIIGEGGNLGLTQRARIEFASRGGLVYTDSIDNSGGVDCSDHEVNIKILLNQVVALGDMTTKQRNELLARMTDEVAGLVLRDNYLQTQAISVAAAQSFYMLGDHTRLISLLEKEGRLERRLEALPSNEEILEYETAHTGLTRPEIAVLLAYSKLRLYEELLASEIHEDTHLCCELQTYFPTMLRQRFATQIKQHSLRREILATHITNSVINRMGCTYCTRIQEDTGASAADIARAYTIAKEIFDIEAIWETIEALDNEIPTPMQVEMIDDSRRFIERSTRWLLLNCKPPLEVASTIQQFAEPVRNIGEHLQELLSGQAQDKLKAHIEKLATLNIPKRLAERIAELDPLFASLDIGEVARDNELDIVQVGQTYFDLGLDLDLELLSGHIAQLPRQTHWQRKIRGLLRDDLNKAQRAMTAQILSGASKSVATKKHLQNWLAEKQENMTRYQGIIAELKSASKVDMAMLSVAVRELREL